MNLVVNNLMIPIEEDCPQSYLKYAANSLKTSPDQLKIFKILNKIFIPKNKEQFYYEVSLVVSAPDSFSVPKGFVKYNETANSKALTAVKTSIRPVIVGFGPAGIFTALELLENGIKPIIFERGQKIEDRAKDIQNFIKSKELNPDSNIQFGEGGAGSYSDGKLFSRKNNTPHVQKVLETFVKFGAPPKIIYISKPHLGTDVLCKVIKNIRNFIIENGGKINFGSKLTNLDISENRIKSITINESYEVETPVLYLAVGHSARETFKLLHQKGVQLEQKPISVGVRLEHPAPTINLIRYGTKYHNFPGLEAATYSFNFTNREIGRGVYTFCQCPGGEIVNASSQNGMLVVNGMSYSSRSGPYSNAAIVVTCKTEDYPTNHPLAGIEFQEQIERAAFLAGGGDWSVPAQNLIDFLEDVPSENLRENSCKTGTFPADMRKIFPNFVITELKNAFRYWKTEEPLFVSDQGILLAAESRTTSPVRITRKANFESANIRNLFPIGEGAGYAGGISSAATDGIRVVENSLCKLK